MRRAGVLFAVVLLLGSGNAFAQQASGADNLRLAMSSEDYQVTPGDLYSLTYWQAGSLASTSLLVQSDQTIDMGIFGTLNAAGMTFARLRPAVDALVTRVYPRGLPSLAISSLGAFRVLVKGDGSQARSVAAWGLSRLGDVVAQVAGPFSSLRDVAVASKDGSLRHYDLFKAQRLGTFEDDPYVRPGDVVILTPAPVTVHVAGEVREPGAYQLLPGENLRAILDFYGGGMTPAADRSRVCIDRFSDDTVRTLFVDLRDPALGATQMVDGDMVRVPPKTDSLAIVYFEGAVSDHAASPAAGAPANAAAGGYNRLVYKFKEGETLRDAVLAIRDSLSPMADLQAATLHDPGTGETTAVDLETLLTSTDGAGQIPLHPFDRIVIPSTRFTVFVLGAVANPGSYVYAPGQGYRYYLDLAGYAPTEAGTASVFVTDSNGNRRDPADPIQRQDTVFVSPAQVTVWGAVNAPGNYPYLPGRNVTYYESLAGGVDSMKSSNGQYTVIDAQGKSRSPGGPIAPGDRIHVMENSFLYNFNLYFPLLSSTVTFVAAVLTITQIVIQLTPR